MSENFFSELAEIVFIVGLVAAIYLGHKHWRKKREWKRMLRERLRED